MLVLGNLAALNLFGSTPPYAQPTIVSSAILANTTGTKFTLSVESDQAATIYYVVGTTNTNPSAAQVRAGNLGGGAPVHPSAAATAQWYRRPLLHDHYHRAYRGHDLLRELHH